MKRKIILLFISLLLLLIPLNLHAISTDNAEEPILLTQSCELTLVYMANQTPIVSESIRLYRVASVSTGYVYSLTDDFVDTKLTINGITSQSEWNTVRSTIESYVYAKKISSHSMQLTNEEGKAIFSAIEPGLYFIPSLIVTIDGFRYYYKSALISLPGINDDGSLNYIISAQPKPDVRPPQSSDLDYSVTKLWKNDSSMIRPKNIEVDIIRNGAVVKTVTLSSDNNWYYSWNAEDDGSIWTVAERNIAEGYKVTIENNQTHFSIVNSFTTPPDEPPPTGDTTKLPLYIFFICLASGVLLIVGSNKRSKNHEQE